MRVRNHLVLGAVGAAFIAVAAASAITGGRGVARQGAMCAGSGTAAACSTGAVNRTIESKLRDVISVYDFGCAGDGTTDDSTCVTNAISASGSNQVIGFDCPGSFKTTAYGTVSCGDYYPPISGATGSFPRSVPNKILDIVDVKDFGAKGDGVTNDTTAIQNALNSLSNGGTVYVPNGVYITNSAITLPANIELRGSGSSEAWNGTGVKGSVIKNITNGNTFTITNVTAVALVNLTLYGSTSTGAHLSIDGGGGAGAASKIRVYNSTFLGKDNAVKTANTVFQVFLENSIFSAQNAEGILVDTSAGFGDTSIYVLGTWVRGSGAAGIQTQGAAGVVNMVIDHSQVSNLSAANKSAIVLDTVNGGAVTNTDIETITGTGSANGIWVKGSSGIYIFGNQLYDVRGNAPIYGSTMYRSSIGPNRILKGSAGTAYAIQLDSGSFDNIVTDQSTDYTVPGAVVFDGGTYNIIMLHGLVNTRALATTRTALTYGVSVATDASLGNSFTITATNGTAFAIANPTNLTAGQRLLYTIRNTSGGALGATTWGGTFKVAAPTALTIATGNSLSLEFLYDGTNLIEIFRTPVVVPN